MFGRLTDITGGAIGRDVELQRILDAVARQQNVLISGPAGQGKSELARLVYDNVERVNRPVIWIPAGQTKNAIISLAKQLHEHSSGLVLPAHFLPARILARARRSGFLPWCDLERTMIRTRIEEIFQFIVDTLERRDRRDVLVIIESLEVPPSLATLYAELARLVIIVAAMNVDNRRIRITRIMWRFSVVIDLQPLSIDACEQIVKRWLQETPIMFAGLNTKERFIRHMAHECRGNPEALHNLLLQALAHEQITPGNVSNFFTHAAAKYFDMTPFVLLALILAMAVRYISRGASMEEVVMMSGVAMTLFMAARLIIGLLK